MELDHDPHHAEYVSLGALGGAGPEAEPDDHEALLRRHNQQERLRRLDGNLRHLRSLQRLTREVKRWRARCERILQNELPHEMECVKSPYKKRRVGLQQPVAPVVDGSSDSSSDTSSDSSSDTNNDSSEDEDEEEAVAKAAKLVGVDVAAMCSAPKECLAELKALKKSITELGKVVQDTSQASSRIPVRDDFASQLQGYASDGMLLLRQQSHVHLLEQYHALSRKYNQILLTHPHAYARGVSGAKVPFDRHPLVEREHEALAGHIAATDRVIAKAQKSGEGLTSMEVLQHPPGGSATDMVQTLSAMCADGNQTLKLLMQQLHSLQQQRKYDKDRQALGFSTEADAEVAKRLEEKAEEADTMQANLRSVVHELEPRAIQAWEKWKKHEYAMQLAAEAINAELGYKPDADTPNYPLEVRNRVEGMLKRTVNAVDVFSTTLHDTDRILSKRVQGRSLESPKAAESTEAPFAIDNPVAAKSSHATYLQQTHLMPSTVHRYTETLPQGAPGVQRLATEMVPSDVAHFQEAAVQDTQTAFWQGLLGLPSTAEICRFLRENYEYTQYSQTDRGWLWRLLLKRTPNPQRHLNFDPNPRKTPIDHRAELQAAAPQQQALMLQRQFLLEPNIVFDKSTKREPTKRMQHVDSDNVAATMVTRVCEGGKAGFWEGLMETGQVLRCLPPNLQKFWEKKKDDLKTAMPGLDWKKSKIFKKPQDEYGNMFSERGDGRMSMQQTGTLTRPDLLPAFGGGEWGVSSTRPLLMDDMVHGFARKEFDIGKRFVSTIDGVYGAPSLVGAQKAFFKVTGDDPYMKASEPFVGQSRYAVLYPKTVRRVDLSNTGDEERRLQSNNVDPETGLYITDCFQGSGEALPPQHRLFVDLFTHCTYTKKDDDKYSNPDVKFPRRYRKRIATGDLLSEREVDELENVYPVTALIEIGKAFVGMVAEGRFVGDLRMRCLDAEVMMGCPTGDPKGNVKETFHTHFNGLHEVGGDGEDSLPNLSVYYWTAVMLLMESLAYDEEKRLKAAFFPLSDLNELPEDEDSTLEERREKAALEHVKTMVTDDLDKYKRNLFLVARCINAPRKCASNPYHEKNLSVDANDPEADKHTNEIDEFIEGIACAEAMRQHHQEVIADADAAAGEAAPPEAAPPEPAEADPSQMISVPSVCQRTYGSGEFVGDLPSERNIRPELRYVITWSEIMLCLAADQYGHAYYTSDCWEKPIFSFHGATVAPPPNIQPALGPSTTWNYEMEIQDVGTLTDTNPAKIDFDRFFLDRFFSLLTAYRRDPLVTGDGAAVEASDNKVLVALPYVEDGLNSFRFAAYFHVFETARGCLDTIECGAGGNFDSMMQSESACTHWLYEWAKAQICWLPRYALGSIKAACELQPFVREGEPELQKLRDVLGPVCMYVCMYVCLIHNTNHHN